MLSLDVDKSSEESALNVDVGIIRSTDQVICHEYFLEYMIVRDCILYQEFANPTEHKMHIIDSQCIKIKHISTQVQHHTHTSK